MFRSLKNWILKFVGDLSFILYVFFKQIIYQDQVILLNPSNSMELKSSSFPVTFNLRFLKSRQFLAIFFGLVADV